MELSTGFPQLVLIVLSAFSLVLATGALAIVLRVRKTVLTAPQTARFRSELADLAGMQADLSERFTRFQKRQDMRAARAERTDQGDVQAAAAALLAEGQGKPRGAPASKLDLYRQ